MSPEHQCLLDFTMSGAPPSPVATMLSVHHTLLEYHHLLDHHSPLDATFSWSTTVSWEAAFPETTVSSAPLSPGNHGY